MSNAVTGRLAVVLCAAALLLGSCGGDSVDSDSTSDGQTRTTEGALDTAPAKQALVGRQKQVSPDLTVGEARCPARVELRKGVTFGCSVQVEGLPAPWTVTVKDVNKGAKTAEFDYELTKVVLSTARLNDAAKRTLDDQRAQADCGGGSKARLAEVGTIIWCTITESDGLARAITLRVDDMQGKLSVHEP